jgi:hypothetical protein
MRLNKGDIIESSDQGFVQLEFSNGAILALGPSSRLYILQDSGSESRGEQIALDVVMLRGWFKGGPFREAFISIPNSVNGRRHHGSQRALTELRDDLGFAELLNVRQRCPGKPTLAKSRGSLI